MVTAARSAPPLPSQSGGGSFDCVKGDIKTIELDCVLDSVVSLFHVVSYQTRNSDLLDTFANAARYLNSEGIFFFLTSGMDLRSLNECPSVRVKRVEDEKTHLTRIAGSWNWTSTPAWSRYALSMLAESRVDGRLTRFGEEHRMRYLFPAEIDLLAGQTGFDVERSEEFPTGKDAFRKHLGSC